LSLPRAFALAGVVMSPKYDIFKERSDGSFALIESVEGIVAAQQRLGILVVKAPGYYHIWDPSFRRFVKPLAKSA
jgi:hypothetical protein